MGSLLVAANYAAARDISATPSKRMRGIRHVLDLTIKPDPASPYLRHDPDGPRIARLGITMLISAHSQETNFFGKVRAAVSNFDLTKGSREREVWEDAKCHHERGFPKITVQYVDGLITTGQKNHIISARYRQIGLLLPSDEVMPSKRLAGGIDNVGSFIATRTETKKSRLFVDLKLYILQCDLRTGALITASNATGKSIWTKTNAPGWESAQ
jgi:hypothetical protein